MHIIPPDFNEDEFQMVINLFYMKLFLKFGIFDFHIPSRQEENNLGYDFKIKSAVPFYFQYKVSDLYLANTKSDLKNDRAIYNFNDSFGFYSFTLHKDDKTKLYKQHNLFNNLGPHNYYVAPKFYSKSNLLSLQINILNDLYTKYDFYHYTFMQDKKLFSNADNMAFLDKCFYIKPHKIISDNDKHCYSYNIFNETMFHSEPEKIEYENIIDIIYQKINNYNEFKLSLPEISETIKKTITEDDKHNEILNEIIFNFMQDFNIGLEIINGKIESEKLIDILKSIDESYPLIIYRRFLKKHFGINLYLLERLGG